MKTAPFGQNQRLILRRSQQMEALVIQEVIQSSSRLPEWHWRVWGADLHDVLAQWSTSDPSLYLSQAELEQTVKQQTDRIKELEQQVIALQAENKQLKDQLGSL